MNLTEILSGQCKQDFEKWFLLDSDNAYEVVKEECLDVTASITKWFYRLPLSMQYGVYVDFIVSRKEHI